MGLVLLTVGGFWLLPSPLTPFLSRLPKWCVLNLALLTKS